LGSGKWLDQEAIKPGAAEVPLRTPMHVRFFEGVCRRFGGIPMTSTLSQDAFVVCVDFPAPMMAR
jgi:hypothetical protein